MMALGWKKSIATGVRMVMIDEMRYLHYMGAIL
jgi:hypothetical protein